MMRSFANVFFNRFGAQTYPLDDELVVELPSDLASVFGKPRLYLVFADESQGTLRELSPAEDLLVYGSRIFDQMLGLLAGRGEAAQLSLPIQIPGDSDSQPVFPLPLHNCRLLENLVQTDTGTFYVFNFRAVYLSDEKQEAFITIALDPAGRPHSATAQALAGLESLHAPNPPVPLDPRTLRQMFDRATEEARQQVEARATELEHALQLRLQKILLRLTTFYRRLADEVDTGDPSQDEAGRADLQADLARKIADELERHRLRVTLSPFSYAMVLAPLAHYRLTLATRHTHHTLRLTQNLHTGQMEDLTCYHCQQSLEQLALCDRGHAVHPACLATCCRCERDICQGCGIQPCAICSSPVCGDCTAACAYCDRWLCATHIATCAICGQAYCADHSFRCRWCEQVYCAQCGSARECQTCQAIMDNPIIETSSIPVISDLDPNRYDWRRAENREFVIYWGRGKGFYSLWLGQLVMVTDKAGKVVRWRKFGWWQRLFTK